MSATTTYDLRRPAPSLGSLAGEQLLVAGGQLAAGLGNLAFSLVAARLLAPGAFGELAAFLALYLVVHVPTASLSAGSALTPALADALRGRVLRIGAAAGLLLAVLSVPLGALLHVPATLMLALAAAAPTAGLIALERGRLYGLDRPGRATASLVAEPVVRLTAGVALGALLGPAGAALGVTIAGWAALAVAHERRAGAPAAAAAPFAGASGATVLAFLGLAVVQNQDVLVANATLGPAQAGRFAVLSTLGGVAAFATTTVPLMLLPRSAAGDRRALPAALAVAGLLGLGAMLVVALGPGTIVSAFFGARYAPVAALAVPYLLAMALLGVTRVLIAHACATGAQRPALALLGGGIVLHLALLLTLGGNAAGIAHATLIATASLATASAGAAVYRLPAARRRLSIELRPPSATGWYLIALTVGALVLRLIVGRSLWIDEATTAHQISLPFGAMLHNLETTDVHPPLDYAIEWVTVRIFGTGETALRLPSLLALTAIVPLLYVTGRELWDRRAGLAAATLAAVAPFVVWYAQEARMYALFMLLATLAFWLQVRAIRHGTWRDWLLYSVAAAALMWTQYFAVLFLLAQQVGFAVAAYKGRADWRRWAGSVGLLALLVAPVLPFGYHQFSVNESAGKGFESGPSQAGAGASKDANLQTPSVYAAITNVIWGVFGYHSDGTMTRLGALWPAAMLGALALLGRRRSRATQLTVLCMLVPMAGLFLIGQVKPFVFEIRYFSASVPLALLLIGRAATGFSPRAYYGAGVTAVIAAAMATGVADQQLNSDNPRDYDYRGAMGAVHDYAKPGDMVLYSPQYTNNVIEYYAKGLPTGSLSTKPKAPRKGQRVFVIFSAFHGHGSDARTTQLAVQRLRRTSTEVRQIRRPQVHVWEFTR
jgi:O-antigen/teichoic acid export membrane protein